MSSPLVMGGVEAAVRFLAGALLPTAARLFVLRLRALYFRKNKSSLLALKVAGKTAGSDPTERGPGHGSSIFNLANKNQVSHHPLLPSPRRNRKDRMDKIPTLFFKAWRLRSKLRGSTR